MYGSQTDAACRMCLNGRRRVDNGAGLCAMTLFVFDYGSLTGAGVGILAG